MIRKICTHQEPRHLDDFLSTAYVKYLFPHAEVEFVHPQRVPQEYVDSSDVILIDVGMDYNPEKKNFDHHQSIDLPCSLILVLNHFSEIDTNIPILQVIDCIDRFGFQKAQEKFEICNSERLRTALKAVLYTNIEKYYKEITKAFLSFLECGTYENFILSFHDVLKANGILDESYLRLYKEEVEFFEVFKEVKVLSYGKIKVAVSTRPVKEVYRFFNITKVDLLISPGSFSPETQTSIIKNTSSETGKLIDLNKLHEKFKVDFIHPNGFIAVIGMPIKDIDIQKIVSVILP